MGSGGWPGAHQAERAAGRVIGREALRTKGKLNLRMEMQQGNASTARAEFSSSFWKVQGGKTGKVFREDCGTFSV